MYLGAPGLVGHRAAGVAVVVADHEPPTVGEHPAEALLPPQHRRPDAHDQKDGGILRVAERLRAELDTVCFDFSVGHSVPSFVDDLHPRSR